jgi:chaperonin GroEL (HSP60 family)
MAHLISSHGASTRTGKYVDMIKGGIIDPLKVIRTALVDGELVDDEGGMCR